MRSNTTRGLHFLAACALGWGLAGPTLADGQAAKLYEDALTRFERGDTGGAVVQLKNALQRDARLLPAQVLLGKALLVQGDAAGAEDALTKALALGVDRSEVAVPLAQALYDQAKYGAVLERFPPEQFSGRQRVELLVLRGHALKGLGDLKQAEAAFEAARAQDPKYAPALVSLAELQARTGRQAQAAKVVDEALALSPAEPRLWTLKASLARETGDTAGALAAYAKAIGAAPNHADARIGRASLLLDLGRDREAGEDLDALKKSRPDDPRANYLRAVYLGRAGDSAGTRDALAQVIRYVDPVPRETLRARAPDLLLLGGLSHYGLAQAEKARSYLEDYLRLEPTHLGTRRVLGALLLAQGDARGALSVLEPAVKQSPADAHVLALLAAAYMARRQYQTAATYLDQALKAGGGRADIQTTLGLSLLGSGSQDLGLEHLRQAFAKDPSQGRAGVPLAVLYLQRGQAKEAAAVAEALAERDPKNTAVLNLLGAARAGAGDLAGARTAFERAVAIDPALLPAQLNLARLELRAGQGDAARKRLEAILKARPKNTTAMIELARVAAADRKPDEAIRWLEKARAIERRNVAATAALVDLYLARNDYDKALAVARDADAAAPDSLPALAALTRASLAAGDEKAAQVTLGRMSRLAGYEPAALAEVARYQLAAKDLKGAAFSLDKALSARPDFLTAQVLLAEVELAGGNAAGAEARAKTIAARHPEQAAGHRLLADVAITRKNYPAAIQAYRTALAKQPSTEGALAVYRAYAESGATAEGAAFMESWVKAHPRDVAAMVALAEAQLRAGNLGAARASYEQLLKLQGEDPALLNNLANILQRQGDPKALAYAEKAHKLAPNDASIQDTLGWILVQRGDLDAGLRHLREARLRRPQNPEIRYHLAAALAKTGRRDQARQELEEALQKSPAGFESERAARQLLAELEAR